jgi:predicted RecB family nuclease
VEQIQGIAPEMAYVVLGTRERFPIRIANVSAYFRRLQNRFREATTARAQTSPYPCDHCLMCGYQSVCETQWEREDHLVRVAGIRHDQVNRLATAGLTTLTALAKARPDTRVAKIPAATFEGLHEQAALQFESQSAKKISYLELPIEDGRGFAALPQRSTGDIILDLEGHPFFEPARGLTFLFGILTIDGDTPRYQPFWAYDYSGERRALKSLSILFMRVSRAFKVSMCTTSARMNRARSSN